MGKLVRTLSECCIWREYILIFVCLGTKRFPFNRLLKQIDKLIENGAIEDEVFAQIGNSTYLPQNFKYTHFLSPEDYEEKLNQSDIVISHGGTGAIIKALKANKQVIAVPRREKLGEHSDDHQLQIVELFSKQGLIKSVLEVDDLQQAIKDIVKNPIIKKFDSKGKIIEIIDDFIMNN